MGKFKIKNFYIFGVMKLRRYFWITILTITALLVSIFPAMTQQYTSSNILFKASTISPLAVGIFDDTTNFKQLKKHGNFGLGTVNSLDGEMVGLDGKFY
ncbi:acetolactate decarboxylase [Nostoc sp.]|uniref:acetolactate decarboxylase n=1 Tax=Nostoc sp. TaxID=1180 RepID=UPI002FF7F439